MHVRVGERWVQKYTRDADSEAPAGGASSNVLDLANWLILQLAGGAWDGNPVIDGDALSQTHRPHALSSLPSTPISRSGFYGFGMNVGYDYAGRLRLSHSGGFNQGAATAFTLLPSAGLGIVVLTNGMPIGVPESVIAYFLDYVEAGSVQEDWLTGYEQIVFAPMYVNPSVLADQKPPEHPVPAEPDCLLYRNVRQFLLRTDPGRIRRDITAPAHRSGRMYVLQHWSGNLSAFYPTEECPRHHRGDVQRRCQRHTRQERDAGVLQHHRARNLHAVITAAEQESVPSLRARPDRRPEAFAVDRQPLRRVPADPRHERRGSDRRGPHAGPAFDPDHARLHHLRHQIDQMLP